MSPRDTVNKITFYTKDDCPLCEAAWFVVTKLRKRVAFELERIDITAPGQHRAYGLYCNDIPVVHLNGQEVCRHHVSERALRLLLDSQE